MKVQKLVAPLHEDAQSIFQERDNNQESDNGRHVAIRERKAGLAIAIVDHWGERAETSWTSGHLRLDGLAEVVEHVLDLAGIRANLVEDVAIGFLDVGRTAVLRRATEAISRGTALHGEVAVVLCRW